jgi:hypothetical protein
MTLQQTKNKKERKKKGKSRADLDNAVTKEQKNLCEGIVTGFVAGN